MKINYVFEGNKVIKTIETELGEKEINLLREIYHRNKVDITCCPRTDEERELDISVSILKKCDLVKDQFGIDEYTMTDLGAKFIEKYDNITWDFLPNK